VIHLTALAVLLEHVASCARFHHAQSTLSITASNLRNP
jgi:hypothetical protein